jgi:hypothetical protein
MNKIQYISSLFLTIIFRLVRIFPNNDPIMGFMLPAGRKSMLKSASFAFLAMFIFDFFTSGIGVHTWVTAITYSLIAIVMSYFFKKIKKTRVSHYAKASIIGILIFDIITGPLTSTFIFNQPLLITVLGQIPFTFYHLISGVSFTLVIAPFFDLDIRSQYVLYKNQIFDYLISISKLMRLF